jgi:hypothetical protein
VKWRFSALAGGLEGSKFSLFLVILPAKCLSSISPRFHYRRLAFCFLPLTTILEKPRDYFNDKVDNILSDYQDFILILKFL